MHRSVDFPWGCGPPPPSRVVCRRVVWWTSSGQATPSRQITPGRPYPADVEARRQVDALHGGRKCSQGSGGGSGRGADGHSHRLHSCRGTCRSWASRSCEHRCRAAPLQHLPPARRASTATAAAGSSPLPFQDLELLDARDACGSDRLARRASSPTQQKSARSTFAFIMRRGCSLALAILAMASQHGDSSRNVSSTHPARTF